jgi:hypothetical protein
MTRPEGSTSEVNATDRGSVPSWRATIASGLEAKLVALALGIRRFPGR